MLASTMNLEFGNI